MFVVLIFLYNVYFAVNLYPSRNNIFGGNGFRNMIWKQETNIADSFTSVLYLYVGLPVLLTHFNLIMLFSFEII